MNVAGPVSAGVAQAAPTQYFPPDIARVNSALAGHARYQLQATNAQSQWDKASHITVCCEPCFAFCSFLQFFQFVCEPGAIPSECMLSVCAGEGESG